MESAAKRRLGDIIVERGLVSPHQLEEALQVQRQSGGKLGEILVELGFITRVALAGVITEQWDTMRLTSRARKTVELASRDQRIAQQEATIAALLAQVNSVAVSNFLRSSLRSRR